MSREQNTDRPELIRFLARDQLAERVRQPAPRAEVTLTEGTTPVIRIYDVIDSWGGFWGVSSAEVAAALDLIPDGTATVEVHLNSPGGEATEGVAIANLLRQHPARVVAVVDGLCASAASMVAMGADEVVMAPSSQMMVHEASGSAWGDADSLERTARALHHLSDSYAAAYAGKAGGTAEDWRALMRAETWYSPDEAVAAGLADRAMPARTGEDDAAAAVARHDLRVFAYAGRADAPAPPISPAAQAGATAAAGSTTRKEPDLMSDTLLSGLRERLGIADDAADEAVVLSALDEALAEQTQTPVAQLPAGTVTIDAAQLEELRAAALAGQAARAQQESEGRERLVAAAVQDGRIPPARRDSWLAQLAADPGAAEVLARLEPGLIPLAEIGRNDNADDGDDPVYAALFGAEQKASL